MHKQYVTMPYSKVFASDLQKSAVWYNKAFGLQIVSINSDFATLEYAPGRIMFISRDTAMSRKLSFFSRNMNALRRQLLANQIGIEVDKPGYLLIKDPEGNTIEVINNRYTEDYHASIPSHNVGMIRCSIETKAEMHLIAQEIKDDIELQGAYEALRAESLKHGIVISGSPFIATQYLTQVEAIYACLPVTASLAELTLKNCEYINIPTLDYAVFPVGYTEEDSLRTVQFERRAKFMDFSFTKPEESYYVLEYHKEDYIYVYMPYTWDKGWQEHDKLTESGGEEQ